MFLLNASRHEVETYPMKYCGISTLENIDHYNRRLIQQQNHLSNFRRLIPLSNGYYRIYLYLSTLQSELELPLKMKYIGDLLQIQIEIENSNFSSINSFIDQEHTNLLVFQHNPIFQNYLEQSHRIERPEATIIAMPIVEIQWISYYIERRMNFLSYPELSNHHFFQGLFGRKLLDQFYFSIAQGSTLFQYSLQRRNK